MQTWHNLGQNTPVPSTIIWHQDVTLNSSHSIPNFALASDERSVRIHLPPCGTTVKRVNVGKFGGSRLPRIPKHVSTDARARTPTSRAAHTLAHVRVRASVVRTNNPRFRLFRPFLFRQPVVYQYLHSFPLRRCVFFLRQLPTFFQPHASVVEWLRVSGVRGRGLLREDRLESERERDLYGWTGCWRVGAIASRVEVCAEGKQARTEL